MAELETINEEIGIQQVWDDLVGSLVARRLSSTAGKLDYDYAENAITMQSGGDYTNIADRLMFNFQYPHACVVDGEMRLHIHWEQTTLNKIEFRTEYRVQNNGVAKTTAWTVATANSTDDSAFAYTSGTLNQITKLANVSMAGAGISATVQFRVTRTDVTTGNVRAVFIDAHVKRDMIGSRSEYVK